MLTTILAATGALTGLSGLVLGGYALLRIRGIGAEAQTMANRAVAVSASGTDPRGLRDVAVHHYDALEEMSGARSFSLAVLDSQGDGVVLTSINGRNQSRTYAKALVRGEAESLLSPEEYRAVRAARLGHGVGTSGPQGAGPEARPEPRTTSQTDTRTGT